MRGALSSTVGPNEQKAYTRPICHSATGRELRNVSPQDNVALAHRAMQCIGTRRRLVFFRSESVSSCLRNLRRWHADHRCTSQRFAVGSRAIGVDAGSPVGVVRHRTWPTRAPASTAAQSAVAVIFSVRSSRRPAPGNPTPRSFSSRCESRVAASFGQDRGKFGAVVAESAS